MNLISQRQKKIVYRRLVQFLAQFVEVTVHYFHDSNFRWFRKLQRLQWLNSGPYFYFHESNSILDDKMKMYLNSCGNVELD